MNASKSYHKNHSRRKAQFTPYTFSINEIDGEYYANPGYRLYWYDHVSAMADFTATARLILGRIIRDQRDEQAYCSRSVQHLAARCGCSVRTVARSLSALSKDGIIRIYSRYRRDGRGRTSSRIYVNWEHQRWSGCERRPDQAICGGVPASVTEDTQLDQSMTAILAEDSLRESSSKPATAVSMTVEEQAQPVSTAEEKPQAEKVEDPETAPETTQRVVLGTLIELGVPATVALSDAKRAPVEALAVLAIVYRILNRGGVRNPAGLARAALRDPGRYLPTRVPAPPGGVALAVPVRARPCWKCGLPLDPLEGCVDGMHFACDEGSRG